MTTKQEPGQSAPELETLNRRTTVFRDMIEHEAEFDKNRALLESMFECYSSGPSVRALYGPYSTAIRHLMFNAGALSTGGDKPGSMYMVCCAGDIVRIAIRGLFYAACRDGLVPTHDADGTRKPQATAPLTAEEGDAEPWL